MLVIEPFDPSRQGRSSQLRLGGLHERKEMIGVAASELIGLGPLYEAIERVLADRLQHPEAVASVAKEALVDERLEDVEVGVAHVFGRLQGAAAGEDGQPGEQPLLLAGEEVV